MRYARLGRSGLEVSRICLGTLTFASPDIRPFFLTEDQARPIIRRALELGVTFYDTADLYSNGLSEEILGRALADFARREDVVIATKLGGPMGRGGNHAGLSRKHIVHAVEMSLRRLGTDYIDLYQFHRWDPATPIEETLAALDDLVRTGKVRYLGASGCLAYQLCKARDMAAWRGWSTLVSVQNFYNLAYREDEREMIPYCLEEGVGILPWSPGARGVLAGNRRPGGGDTVRAQHDDRVPKWFDERSYAIAARVAEVARRRGCTPMQIAYAWLLGRPGVTAPVIGVTSTTQLEQDVEAVNIELDAEERDHLEALYVPRPLLAMELQPRSEVEQRLIDEAAGSSSRLP